MFEPDKFQRTISNLQVIKLSSRPTNIIQMDIEPVETQQNDFSEFGMGDECYLGENFLSTNVQEQKQINEKRFSTDMLPPPLPFDYDQDQKQLPPPKQPSVDSDDEFSHQIDQIRVESESQTYHSFHTFENQMQIESERPQVLPELRIYPKISPLEFSKRFQARLDLPLEDNEEDFYSYRSPETDSRQLPNNFRTRIWHYLDEILIDPEKKKLFSQILGQLRQNGTTNLPCISSCFESLSDECLNFFLSFATKSIFASSKAKDKSKRAMLRHLGVFTQGAKKGYIINLDINRRN